MKVKTIGSVRSIEGEWSVNFGPDSDVDAEIPGSNGVTLRDLKESGEIRADCFEEEEND